MSRRMDIDRRRFLGAALVTFAAPELAVNRSTSARSNPGTPHALGTLRQVAAGVLNVGYAEAGPATGRPVVLHGWPYDIHSFVDARSDGPGLMIAHT